jgi:predicted small secreted protein
MVFWSCFIPLGWRTLLGGCFTVLSLRGFGDDVSSLEDEDDDDEDEDKV